MLGKLGGATRAGQATGRTIIYTAALALFATGIAACTGSTVRLDRPLITSFTPGMLNYASSHGGVAVEVAGEPFGEPSNRVAVTVAEQIKATRLGPEMAYRTGEDTANASTYRIVTVFGPRSDLAPASVCANATPATSADDSEVTALMVFCDGARRISSLYGTSAARSLDDPEFGVMIRLMAQKLMPYRDMNVTGQDQAMEMM